MYNIYIYIYIYIKEAQQATVRIGGFKEFTSSGYTFTRDPT